MQNHKHRSNAEVLDILFAVALGEGFIASMQNYREHFLSGDVLSFGDTGQGAARMLLAFMIVILSWLYYRRATMTARVYPTTEFVMDILVMMSYIALFIFIDESHAFYTTIAVVWTIYLLARIAAGGMTTLYFMAGVSFIVVFAAIAATTRYFDGDPAEWLRIAFVTMIAIAYRHVDARFTSSQDSEEELAGS